MDYKERVREQDLQKIQQLRIFDDEFLKEIFDGNTEATELVLNIVFGRNDLKVMKVIGQREIKGIEGHSVRLDIMAQDSENHAYDIEVQRQDSGWLPLRARYNSSMMDTVLLPSGEDYSKLIPTYVIFFTETDTVGDKRPLHHYVMRDIETNDLLGDERHIMFVNGENDDESTRLGKLVHDFKCTSADDMYYDVLAKRVRHFKETEGGVSYMSKIMDEVRIEATIDTLRDVGISESEIKEKIMAKFKLSEKEAKSYMEKKIA